MDDHLYYKVLEYGKCWLIPRLQEEYKEYGLLKACPSYNEAKDFCKVLTILGEWGMGLHRVTLQDLLAIDC